MILRCRGHALTMAVQDEGLAFPLRFARRTAERHFRSTHDHAAKPCCPQSRQAAMMIYTGICWSKAHIGHSFPAGSGKLRQCFDIKTDAERLFKIVKVFLCPVSSNPQQMAVYNLVSSQWEKASSKTVYRIASCTHPVSPTGISRLGQNDISHSRMRRNHGMLWNTALCTHRESSKKAISISPPVGDLGMPG